MCIDLYCGGNGCSAMERWLNAIGVGSLPDGYGSQHKQKLFHWRNSLRTHEFHFSTSFRSALLCATFIIAQFCFFFFFGCAKKLQNTQSRLWISWRSCKMSTRGGNFSVFLLQTCPELIMPIVLSCGRGLNLFGGPILSKTIVTSSEVGKSVSDNGWSLNDRSDLVVILHYWRRKSHFLEFMTFLSQTDFIPFPLYHPHQQTRLPPPWVPLDGTSPPYYLGVPPPRDHRIMRQHTKHDMNFTANSDPWICRDAANFPTEPLKLELMTTRICHGWSCEFCVFL